MPGYFPAVFLLAVVLISHVDASCYPYCVEGAECIYGHCVCYPSRPGFWGRGDFRCYNHRTVAAEIRSDTTLTNFNGETVDFNFPCRYLIAHARTDLKNSDKTIIGKCEFEIHGFNAKTDGKIFAHGFDVAIKLRYFNGMRKKVSVRVFGKAIYGFHHYYFQRADNAYLPNGPWTDGTIRYRDRPNGVELRSFLGSHKTAQFIAKKCGLTVNLKAYDLVLKRYSHRTPGISVAVDCGYHPKWRSRDRVMGLPPTHQGGQRYRDIRLTGLTKGQSVLLRAFQGGFVQNQPIGNDECNVNPFLGCDGAGLTRARHRCFWILEKARFIRCIEGVGITSGEIYLNLFNRCVQAECSASAAACNTVKSDIIVKIAQCGVLDIGALTTYTSTAC